MFIGQHLCAHSQCGCMRESRTQGAPVSMRTALAPSASLPVSRPCTLARLTPRNAAGSLYNDVPWPKRAAEEHDAFAAVLERRGIAVDYLGPSSKPPSASLPCARPRSPPRWRHQLCRGPRARPRPRRPPAACPAPLVKPACCPSRHHAAPATAPSAPPNPDMRREL